MITKGSGRLREKVKAGAPNPMADPSNMVNMMKQNMSMMLPNVVMMGWISYFFSGFVLAKVPFTLTERFKSMLQRGVELQSLDVSYVSSLSWYFLVMFGLRGLFTLILGSASGVFNSFHTPAIHSFAIHSHATRLFIHSTLAIAKRFAFAGSVHQPSDL
jgi:hypothetical protein